MKTLVSVIIPIYNVEKYIKECLESVVNQTLKDIEIICVDDCGSDNSIDIVKEYAQKDNRIKIVHHETNKGLGAARNTGMKAAKGEYFGFVDSDDWVSINFFKELYESAKLNNADIVQSFVTFYHDDIARFEHYILNKEIKKFNSEENKIIKMDLYYNAGMCWNKIFKADLIKQNQLTFPEKLYWEDNPFVIRAAYYANKIIPCDKAQYFYRQRENSIVKKVNKKLHFDLVTTHEDIINFLNTTQIEKEEYLFLFNRFMNRLYWEYEKIEQNFKLTKYKKEYIKHWKNLYKKCLYLEEFEKLYEGVNEKLYFKYSEAIETIFLKIVGLFTCSAKILFKALINSPHAIRKLNGKNK